jgi:hypothetical protein
MVGRAASGPETAAAVTNGRASARSNGSVAPTAWRRIIVVVTGGPSTIDETGTTAWRASGKPVATG